ncbi:hypothetical protein D3C72_1948080 [compost metagenome]
MTVVVRNVPPSSVSLPPLAPRLASLAIDSAPSWMVQFVASAVAPVSVQVLLPRFSNTPKP